MNKVENDIKWANIRLITANVNYMRDELIASEKDFIKREEMLDKLKSETKQRLINILLPQNEK